MNQLRAKLSKLRHGGHITDAEYQDFIKKMYGHEKGIRAKAIYKFAERLKAILEDMQISSLQGEDDCPHDDCPYGNQSITCEYCIREQTIKDIEKIAEEMRGAEW